LLHPWRKCQMLALTGLTLHPSGWTSKLKP
jgi:hypothetical protein